MTTRDEVLGALTVRYGQARRAEKARILAEFVALTGYHRKHAARLLRGGGGADRSAPRPQRRLYDDAVREALIMLWEASDRICGKRLKPLIPMLVAAMERHGHLALNPAVRERLPSCATGDRSAPRSPPAAKPHRTSSRPNGRPLCRLVPSPNLQRSCARSMARSDHQREEGVGVALTFVRGLRADVTAVTAALRETWLNGQTEGQINRMKTLKRKMYDRAGIDLLRARLVATP